MAYPATITLTIAPATTRVLNRINQDSYGSEYQYSDAVEQVVMKIRHSKDTVDGDGVVMKRHNVFVERVVYPTPVLAMKKFSATFTMRHGQYDDPAAAATLSTGVTGWLGTGTNAADLAVGTN